MTGKAAGSAGVCTTDTCLDSITGSGNHSFLPIKTEKTDPSPSLLRKSTRASPPSSSPTLPVVSVTASSHPMPPSTTLCSTPLLFPPPPPPPLRSSFLPGPRDTKSAKSGNTFMDEFRMSRGLADAFHSFIFFVIHLFPIRSLDRGARKNASPLAETFRHLVTVMINIRFNNFSMIRREMYETKRLSKKRSMFR